MPRPTDPPARMRSTRVPDAVWDAAKKKSEADGVFLSEVVVCALRDYESGTYRPSIIPNAPVSIESHRTRKTAKRKTTARRSKPVGSRT